MKPTPLTLAAKRSSRYTFGLYTAASLAVLSASWAASFGRVSSRVGVLLGVFALAFVYVFGHLAWFVRESDARHWKARVGSIAWIAATGFGFLSLPRTTSIPLAVVEALVFFLGTYAMDWKAWEMYAEAPDEFARPRLRPFVSASLIAMIPVLSAASNVWIDRRVAEDTAASRATATSSLR